MAKKASTYPASEWARSMESHMSDQTANRLCREGRVEGATQYLGKWMVIKGTPDPRHPVGAPRKTTNGKDAK